MAMGGKYDLGTATDDEILAHRARVDYEQKQKMEPIPWIFARLNDGKFQCGGCSSIGSERRDGHGWVYCINKNKCRAESTIHDRAKRKAAAK
jgi:hypothetical protein